MNNTLTFEHDWKNKLNRNIPQKYSMFSDSDFGSIQKLFFIFTFLVYWIKRASSSIYFWLIPEVWYIIFALLWFCLTFLFRFFNEGSWLQFSVCRRKKKRPQLTLHHPWPPYWTDKVKSNPIISKETDTFFTLWVNRDRQDGWWWCRVMLAETLILKICGRYFFWIINSPFM